MTPITKQSLEELKSEASKILSSGEHVFVRRDVILDLIARVEGLSQALENIKDHIGKTNLSDCCVDRTCLALFEGGEKIAHCIYQGGVARGFNTCGHEAKSALESFGVK